MKPIAIGCDPNAEALKQSLIKHGEALAKRITGIWLKEKYEPGGRSEPKVQAIVDYEKSHVK